MVTVTFGRTYSIRRAVQGKPTYITTIPVEVLEVAARRASVSLDEFVSTRNVRWALGDSGAHVEFLPKRSMADETDGHKEP